MRGKRLAIVGLVFALLVVVTVVVLAYADFDNTFRMHDPWDITHTTCPYDALAALDDGDWWAWMIDPDGDWVIEGIELYVSCCGGTNPAPSSPITFEVYIGSDYESTYPPFLPYNLLGQGIYTGTVTDYDNYPNIDTITISLSSPITLTSIFTYWLTLSSNADSSANKWYDLYASPGSGSGCSASKPSWLIEEHWCDPSTNPPTCYFNASDGGDIMPFAIVGQLAGGTPTPTPTPTVKATSTPQATPTPVRYTQIYAAEVVTPELRPALIVHYNP